MTPTNSPGLSSEGCDKKKEYINQSRYWKENSIPRTSFYNEASAIGFLVRINNDSLVLDFRLQNKDFNDIRNEPGQLFVLLNL